MEALRSSLDKSVQAIEKEFSKSKEVEKTPSRERDMGMDIGF